MRRKSKALLQLSWDRVEIAIAAVAEKIIGNGNQYDIILAVSKGGLVPAALLADYLQKPVEAVVASHYTKGQTSRNEQVTFGVMPVVYASQRYLIVDDVLETGETMNQLISMLRQNGVSDIGVVVLTHKTEVSKINANDLYAPIPVEYNSWIVFPWEKNEFKQLMQNESGVNTKA